MGSRKAETMTRSDNRDLQLAVRLLEECDDTFVAVRAETLVFRSKARGVAPVFEAMGARVSLSGAVVADRVIGRAMALLLAGEGVRLVYGQTVSTPARVFLNARGLFAGAGREVPGIRNRAGDGPCPMEQATMDIEDPAKALAVVGAIRRDLMGHGRG